MCSAVKAISRKTTYTELKSLLIEGPSIKIFPVIDNEQNQMLVGTVSRRYLLELLERQVGDETANYNPPTGGRPCEESRSREAGEGSHRTHR